MTRIPMMLLRTKVGELVNRALLRDEAFLLERKGKPVAVLVSVERWQRMTRAARSRDDAEGTDACSRQT